MLKHFPFRNLLPAMVVLAFAMTMAGCSGGMPSTPDTTPIIMVP